MSNLAFLFFYWACVIVAFVVAHARLHSEKKRVNHTSSFLIRAGLAIPPFFLFPEFKWYWMAGFLVFTYQAFFKTLYNYATNKPSIAYMSRTSNGVDKLQLKIWNNPVMWWYIEIFLMIGFTSMIIFYGECNYEQINSGLCH